VVLLLALALASCTAVGALIGSAASTEPGQEQAQWRIPTPLPTPTERQREQCESLRIAASAAKPDPRFDEMPDCSDPYYLTSTDAPPPPSATEPVRRSEGKSYTVTGAIAGLVVDTMIAVGLVLGCSFERCGIY